MDGFLDGPRGGVRQAVTILHCCGEVRPVANLGRPDPDPAAAAALDPGGRRAERILHAAKISERYLSTATIRFATAATAATTTTTATTTATATTTEITHTWPTEVICASMKNA